MRHKYRECQHLNRVISNLEMTRLAAGLSQKELT